MHRREVCMACHAKNDCGEPKEKEGAAVSEKSVAQRDQLFENVHVD